MGKLTDKYNGYIKHTKGFPDESEYAIRNKVAPKLKRKEDTVKRYKTEISRLASMANKRLKRLEKNGLQDSPAYQKWLSQGGEKFSVRGKDFNQLQKELARLRNFIDSETSTVRGVNRVLKGMAKTTGMKYRNLKELRVQAKQFFELASKVEQYLRNVEDMASAIGYQKIWEQINMVVEAEKIDLANSNNNIEELTQKVVKAIDIYGEREKVSVSSYDFSANGWFELKKE